MVLWTATPPVHPVGEWLCEEGYFSLAYLVARGSLECWREDSPYLDGSGFTVSDYATLTLPKGSVEQLDDDDRAALEAAVWQAAFAFDFLEIEDARRREARPATWGGLDFRSQSERRIAEALERAGVGFTPNARGRWGSPDAREVREPDFLVMSGRRVGVLEVDGFDYHNGLASRDHDRDRLFWHHGLFVQRFAAERCYQRPDEVVAEFLQLLLLNG